MERFRLHLRHEFYRRVGTNPRYSLRSFARTLNIHHATLSSLMSGRRTLTPAHVRKLGPSLGLGPVEVQAHLEPQSETGPFVALQEDVFASMSEPIYDAVMELSTIVELNEDAGRVAKILNVPDLRAKHILDTLRRLQMLVQDEGGRLRAKHPNTTNILDESVATAAQIKYQAEVLSNSARALKEIPRAQRSHTSLTVAMSPDTLPAARDLIRKFRRALNALAQRPGVAPKEIYQLQASYFPISERAKK